MPTHCVNRLILLKLCNYVIIGPKHRQRFLCEVRVDGFSYAGAGNSTTKKDAQVNASRDFVNYLVRTGNVSSSEVPEEVAVKTEGGSDGASNFGGPAPFSGPPQFDRQPQYDRPQPNRPVFQVNAKKDFISQITCGQCQPIEKDKIKKKSKSHSNSLL